MGGGDEPRPRDADLGPGRVPLWLGAAAGIHKSARPARLENHARSRLRRSDDGTPVENEGLACLLLVDGTRRPRDPYGPGRRRENGQRRRATQAPSLSWPLRNARRITRGAAAVRRPRHRVSLLPAGPLGHRRFERLDQSLVRIPLLSAVVLRAHLRFYFFPS